MPRYRIYPSLLDKYQQLLDYSIEAQQPWNVVSAAQADHYPGLEEGDLILSEEQIYDRIEQELLDMVNRTPHAPIEAASRGTALNEIIDTMIMGGQANDDIKLGRVHNDKGEVVGASAELDGFRFEFDIDLCRQLRDELNGSLCQVELCAPIETMNGDVLLYGFADYWLRDKIIDLKSTSAYDFGNYQHKWQRRVYPYCATLQGAEVAEFTYLAVVLPSVKDVNKRKGSKLVKAKGIYPETYTYDHREATRELQAILFGLTEWLEAHRRMITNQKIFNYEQ